MPEFHLQRVAVPGQGSYLGLGLVFKTSPEDMFIDLRERGRRRERSIDVRNIHRLPPVHTGTWGSNCTQERAPTRHGT